MAIRIYIGQSSLLGFETLPFDAGASLQFALKRSRSDSTPLIQKTSDITFDHSTNVGQVKLLDSDTADLFVGEAFIEVQAVYSPDESYVVAEGCVDVVRAIGD
jgi:hypothetical protein